MKIIKITGGIGAGKSLAGETLKSLNEAVIDADDVARKFNTSRYLSSATIFSDITLLRQIENKSHPLIVADIERQIEELEKQGKPRVFVLVPALAHFAADIKCDTTIAITAEQETRIHRVITTRKITEQEVILRINNQATDQEISATADHVIENNGTKEQFIKSVKETYNSLV